MTKLSKAIPVIICIFIMLCRSILTANAEEPLQSDSGTHERITISIPDGSSLKYGLNENCLFHDTVIDIKSTNSKDLYVIGIETCGQNESIVYGIQSKNNVHYLAGTLMGNEAFSFTPSDIEDILNAFKGKCDFLDSLNAASLTELLFAEHLSDSVKDYINQSISTLFGYLKAASDSPQVFVETWENHEYTTTIFSLHPDIFVGLLGGIYPWIPENALNGLFHYLQDYGALQVTYTQNESGIPLSVNIHAEKEGSDPENDPVHSVEKELDIEYNFQTYEAEDDYTICADIHGFDENNFFAYLNLTLENNSIGQFYICTDFSWGSNTFSLTARTMDFDSIKDKSTVEASRQQSKYIIIHPEINEFDHCYLIQIINQDDVQNIIISKDDKPYLQISSLKEAVDHIEELHPEYMEQLTPEQVQVFFDKCIEFLSQSYTETNNPPKGGN